MSWWTDIVQYATQVLAAVLIVRLLSVGIKRERVYLLFACFLAFQLLTSLEYFIASRWFLSKVDYRILWMISAGIVWAFTLTLVYSLAKGVLAGLPGVMIFSRKLLSIIFPSAILIALASAWSEYHVAGGTGFSDPIDKLLIVWYVLDRSISMTALLVLLAILAFILWFPVKMVRNLAIFCLGFVVYFAAKTGLVLLRTYSAPGGFSRNNTEMLYTCVSGVLALCFVYWILFIDRRGQSAEVRLGHSWHAADQRKLLDQMESLNLALLRNSQHLKS